MKTRFEKPGILPFVLAITGLLVLTSIEPVSGFASTGPGVQGAGVPQPFSIQDFDSVRRNTSPFPKTMSPGVLHTLGGCVDPQGNAPNSPIEYDLSLRTDEDTSEPWKPGEERELKLILRSSSARWFNEPPRFDFLLVNESGGEGIWIDLGSPVSLQEIQDGLSNTFLVGERSPGIYRIDVFERTTGICKSSDFTFRIAGEGQTGTPTPTPTENLTATPTPTGDGTTPTRTPRMPDYDNNLFVNGFDLTEFLKLLAENDEEADLDGEDMGRFRDLFMFTFWWQNDEIRN